jgi:hypothetical protein
MRARRLADISSRYFDYYINSMKEIALEGERIVLPPHLLVLKRGCYWRLHLEERARRGHGESHTFRSQESECGGQGHYPASSVRTALAFAPWKMNLTLSGAHSKNMMHC